MMKHFKKLTLVTTAAFLFLLTAVTETSALLPLPGITVENTSDEDTAPEVETLADDDENENGENEKKKVY